ncbi:hypothetical protein AAMO2058_000771700, partial [Amorphochlora amoebiformis]
MREGSSSVICLGSQNIWHWSEFLLLDKLSYLRTLGVRAMWKRYVKRINVQKVNLRT